MIDYTTIKETFVLPSKGKMYGENAPEKVTLRSMTTQEDMELLGYSENEYKKLCDAIDACMVDGYPISSYDMVLGDYEFLLHKLRVVTFGSEYNMMLQCPNCKQIVKSKTNLDDIEVIEFDEKSIGKREITLPMTKKVVKLSFQTPRMLDKIKEQAKEYKKKKNKTGVNYELLFKVISFISKIDNEELEDSALEQMITKLPLKDALYIVQKGEELNRKVGLDTSLIAKCPECGYEVLTRFQFQSEFFAPTLIEE